MDKRHGFGLIRKTERWLHRDASYDSVFKTKGTAPLTRFIMNGQVIDTDYGTFGGVGDGCYEPTDTKSIGIVASTRNTFSCQGLFENVIYSSDYGMTFTDDGVVITGDFYAYTGFYITSFAYDTQYTFIMELELEEEKYGSFPMNISVRYYSGEEETLYYTQEGKRGHVRYVSRENDTISDLGIYPATSPYMKILSDGFGIIKGTVGSDYQVVPPKFKQYTVVLPMPLLACGSFSDEYDLCRGSIVKKCQYMRVDKSTAFTVDENGLFRIELPKTGRSGVGAICNKLGYFPYKMLLEVQSPGFSISPSGDAIVMRVKKDQSGEADFYSFFASGGTDFIYNLAEYELHSAPKVNISPEFESFSINAEIAPSKLTIEY